MGTKRAAPEVNPFSLPVGMEVGPWQVRSWRGRGAYGTLYRVEHKGHEQDGEFALKLAIETGDERFGREAELLRRISSPHVPRFRAQGVWEHPAGAFPYVVMEWIEGEVLYEWAARRNPSSRQVLRLMALAPVERFGGRARQVAEALEEAAQGEGSEADSPLFSWSEEHRPRLRSPGAARLAEAQDAAAREDQVQREAREQHRAKVGRARFQRWSLGPEWRWATGVGFLGVLLAGLTVAVLLRGQQVSEAASGSEARKGGRVAVGDSASTAPTGSTSLLPGDKKRGVSLPMPEQPLPGQNRAPCKRMGEVEIRGGCWHRVPDAKPPCKEEGKEDAYAWGGACYWPSLPLGRAPTSSPP